MAYFPHAFQKLLVAKAGFTYTAGKRSLDLTAGQIGIINAQTNAQVQVAAAGVPAKISDLPMIYLAQGSFHPTDKLGPFHGGYQESVKTKGINPRYISKFWVSEPKTAQNQIVEVGSAQPLSLQYKDTYYLRIDVKGSPALRTLQHNLYYTSAAYAGCAPAGSDGTGTPDPAIIFEAWSQDLNSHPILKEFIKTRVKYQTLVDAALPAIAATFEKPATWGQYKSDKKICQLEIQTAYVDTKFGNSSWAPDDFYELEPLFIYASLVDEFDNVCLGQSFTVTETQPVRYAQGTGESYLRELILSKRYRQEDFQYDLRLREVLHDTTLDEIDRTKNYVAYHILHSVPRKANPSSTFDADQYLIKIIVDQRNANFEAFFTKYLELAGNGVKLEVV